MELYLLKPDIELASLPVSRLSGRAEIVYQLNVHHLLIGDYRYCRDGHLATARMRRPWAPQVLHFLSSSLCRALSLCLAGLTYGSYLHAGSSSSACHLGPRFIYD